MADSSNSTTATNADLASRLIDHADSITNVAASGLERDLREASRRLQHLDGSELPVLIPGLVSELAQIANTTTDTVTRERLRKLLGEA
jgi:hypothetical protein